MRRPILLLLLAAAVLAAAPPSTLASTLSPDAYVSELDRLWSALDGAEAAHAEDLSLTLPPEWVVRLEGGGETAVDMRWLVQGLRDAPLAGADWQHTRQRLRRRLEYQRAHAREWRAAADRQVRHDTFRAAVTDVLAEEDFRRAAGPSLLERIQRLIGEWLQSLFQRVGSPVGSRAAALAMAWAVSLGALVVFAVWMLRVLGRPSTHVSFDLARRAPSASAREWATRWRGAIARGDLREAARFAYLAAVRRLEEQGAWRMDDSRTPREYRRALRQDDARAPALAAIADAFERAFYGSQTLTQDDVARVAEGLENLGCLRQGEQAI